MDKKCSWVNPTVIVIKNDYFNVNLGMTRLHNLAGMLTHMSLNLSTADNVFRMQDADNSLQSNASTMPL